MKIRIKWTGHQWWAYFGGHDKSYLHSSKLSDLCDAIATCWPVAAAKEAGK